MYSFSCQSFLLGSMTLWFLTILPVTSGQCSNCGDLQSYNVAIQPLPVPLITGASASPLYGVIETNVSNIQNVDNICNTFTPVNLGTFILARTYVFKDGSYRVEIYLERDVPGRLGVFRLEGIDYCGTSSVVSEERLLGTGCPVSFALARAYMYGSCSKISEQEGKQIRFAVSAQRYLPKVCIDLLKAVCNSQPQLGLLDPETELIELPQNLNYKCVKYIGNASCIGASSIPDEDAISLPPCNCFS